MRRLSFVTILLGAFVLSGCGTGEPATPSGPPAGWSESGVRWWKAGVDTALAFRDLSSLEAMGVAGGPITISGDARQPGVQERQRVLAVKHSLIEIVRNQPEIVDSLYNRFVAPDIIESPPSTSVERMKSGAYRTLSRRFREPRLTKRPGSDIPVVYPDSLRSAGVSGRVSMQVYLDTLGAPVAIWKQDGVHPTLDQIAMLATTEARWQPAYLLGVGKSNPVPAWVMFRLRFGE